MMIRSLAAAVALFAAAPTLAAAPAPRSIEIDAAAASQPFDRSFDLSVDADYAGTMMHGLARDVPESSGR